MSFYRTRNFLQRERIPVTIFVIAANIILFLVDHFTLSRVVPYLAFRVARGVLPLFWTPIAYPLITPDFVQVVFACWWMWFVGGSLERSWGTLRFAVFLLTVTVVMALTVWGGALLLGSFASLYDLWLPLASLTVAWATINPYEILRLYFVIPIQARWLALFFVGVVYFEDFKYDPRLGFFALSGPLLAWLYVKYGFSYGRPLFNRRPPARGPYLKFSTSRPSAEEPARKGNPLAWYRNWQEQRHLKKLWRNSGFSDRDDRKQR
jgi:membrane associated rhomboid family serine protease